MIIKSLINNIPQEILEKGKIAVAFSGGADSMALLLGLSELRDKANGLEFSLMALHCNFHLRGEESERDARFAEEMAKRLSVEFRRKDFLDVRKNAAELGVSLEMICRDLRYDWFREFSDKGYWIAIAHHREDNEETFLLNLFRGSGIKGLRGIPTLDDERRIIRPLLESTRAEIEDFLRRNRIGWVNDSSNAVADVKRNKLRLRIIPEISREFPEASTGIRHTIDCMTTDYRLFKEYLDSLCNKLFDKDKGEIDTGKLRALTNEPVRVLFEIIRDFGFNYHQATDIINITHGEGYKKFISETHRIDANYHRAKIRDNRQSSNLREIVVGLENLEDVIEGMSYRLIDTESPIEYIKLTIKDGNAGNHLFLDSDKFRNEGAERFVYRQPVVGERMAPFGMNGKKKQISDILTDMHSSPEEKESAAVLCDISGKVLWLVGVRSADHYRVDERTRRILHIELKK